MLWHNSTTEWCANQQNDGTKIGAVTKMSVKPRCLRGLDIAQAIKEAFDLCIKVAGFFGKLGGSGLNV